MSASPGQQQLQLGDPVSGWYAPLGQWLAKAAPVLCTRVGAPGEKKIPLLNSTNTVRHARQRDDV